MPMTTIISPSLLRSVKARLDRPLVLIGMMGAGKSRIGRLLAETLDVNFADSDDEIEKAAGCSIAEIFDRYGENFFRDRERKVIQRLLDDGCGVIATGGGAIMLPATAEAIRSQAVSVWIRADLQLILERTSRSENRPLLKTGNPEEVLSALIRERTPSYEKADIIVDSHGGPVNDIAALIFDKLEMLLLKEEEARKG